MHDYKGKTAVITGGASGIGLGLAAELVDQGCNVAITDIHVKNGEAAAAMLSGKGVKVIFIPHDVSKEEDWDRVISTLKNEMNPIDYAFNNAGVVLMPAMLSDLTVKDWQWIINVNLWGALFGLRKFTELMEKQDIQSRIITTSSIAATAVLSTWVPYSVTKTAVLRMVEGYQAEANLAGKVKIKYSVVMPGVVYSNIINCGLTRPKELLNSDVPMQELPRWEVDTPDGINRGMITTEEAAELILTQVYFGDTYIYTHKDQTIGLILEETNSLILNKAPTDQAVFNLPFNLQKAARKGIVI